MADEPKSGNRVGVAGPEKETEDESVIDADVAKGKSALRKGRGGYARARASAPARASEAPPSSSRGSEEPQLFVDFRGGQSLEERLERILGMLRIKEDIQRFVLDYWRDTASVQNPFALYSFLAKVPGVGGGDAANFITGFVFGQPPQQGGSWGPPPWTGPGGYVYGNSYGPSLLPAQEPHRKPETAADEMTRTMMAEMIAMIRVRNMAAAMAPILGAAGSQAPIIEMRPKVGPDGKFLLDERGAPVYEFIPHAPQAEDAIRMMQQFQRGEAVDPTKMMSTMVEMFKTGVQVAGNQKSGGIEPERLLDMQAKVSDAQIEALKARWQATEKMFEQERQSFLQALENLKPEKQLEQIEKWKKLGLLGGENLEALKLQMRMKMWEAQREDAQEAQLAEAQARATEAEKGRQQFHDLIELGRSALTDALKPVTTAIGDGLRDRVAGHAVPAPGAVTPPAQGPPPDYGSMSSEQRAQYRAKLTEIRQKLDKEQARLEAAGA